MKLSQIKEQLNNIGSKEVDLGLLLLRVKDIKKQFVDAGEDSLAKEAWIYETIIDIHLNYIVAIDKIKAKEYFDSWCILERIEVDFHFLSRHYEINTGFKLSFIEARIFDLQTLFPYRIFSSMELVEKRVVCTICGGKITPRKQCSHIVGEIYKGEMCCRRVEEIDFIGLAIVENPAHKYTVLFLKDGNGNRIDYNYYLLDYWNGLCIDYYQEWKLILEKKVFSHDNFWDYKPDAHCPCGSGAIYKDCCLGKEGVISKHFIIEYNKA